MTISVIVATYGGPEWRTIAEERAFPSTVGQGAHEVVAAHQPDGTIATCRNHGAASATGEWLCFLDADDELAPGYVGAMRRAAERHSTPEALLTPAVQQIRKGRPGKPFFFPECSLTTGNWLIIGTLIRREFFHTIGGFRDHPHGLEDWNLWARAVRAGASIVKVRDAVYRAYWNQKSKHHVLARDRQRYMAAYEAARVDAWG